MKHRSIFSGSAIVALTLMGNPVAGLAQEKTLKEQIVGSWWNVFYEQTRPDGRKEQPFGTNPKGITTFDSNGRLSVIVMNPDLPKLASNDRVNPTPEEAMAIAKGVHAYYGTYTVNEGDKSLTFNFEASSFPNQLRAPQKRNVTQISADELKLQFLSSGAGGVNDTGYKRVK